jgi:quinol monooxygenase YgiN
VQTLFAELEAKPTFGKELEILLKGLVETTRQEPGCIHYAVHRDQASEVRFLVYEVYRDAAACQAHLDSAPIKQALGEFEKLLASPPRLVFCDILGATF